jgi:flagellar basal-body rod protein FlgC
MGLFGSIGIAGTGLTVYRKWLDAVSDNIANISTARPTGEDAFQARYIRAQSLQNGGVQVEAAVLSGNTTGRMVYEPDNPIADAKGYVRYPDIDLGSQMTQLIMAQRAYQANLNTISSAREAFQAAIQLGRG